MAKVVITKLERPAFRTAGGRKAAVRTKRARTADGEIRTLSALDVHSPTFSEDLTIVFGRNVSRARRENRRLTGSADGRPT